MQFCHDIDFASLDALVDLAGPQAWQERLVALQTSASVATRAGRAVAHNHCIELAIERLRARRSTPSEAECRITALAGQTVALAAQLPADGRDRLIAMLRAALSGPATLVPVFHVMRTACVHRAHGFAVTHAGLEDDACFDLLIWRDGAEAEIVCDVVSAEDGRGVHRGAFYHLADRIDPELQIWLAAHPGRYILKLMLPQGLKGHGLPGGREALALLHQRITQLLSQQRRADHDEAAVLRLDPLLLAAAQAGELGLVPRLREEFGPEAHLSVTASGGGIFVMAARAGQEDEVAAVVRRRMAALAPARLTGTRPGILAMFIEDTHRDEWRLLRERLELEGEARQFMTNPEARSVVAVTCSSRLELFGPPGPGTAQASELRFRNPAHPAARAAALAPAVLSTL